MFTLCSVCPVNLYSLIQCHIQEVYEQVLVHGKEKTPTGPVPYVIYRKIHWSFVDP
jgi:hypothetical protein